VPHTLRDRCWLWGMKPNVLLPGDLMQRHINVAEWLLREQRITGLCICGTCMMDLDWEADRVLMDWFEKAGTICA